MNATRKLSIKRKILLLKSKMNAHDVDLSWAVAGLLLDGGSYEIVGANWLSFVEGCLEALENDTLPILEDFDIDSGRPNNTRTTEEAKACIWPIQWSNALGIMNQMWRFYAK